jgi:hypothetical protein
MSDRISELAAQKIQRTKEELTKKVADEADHHRRLAQAKADVMEKNAEILALTVEFYDWAKRKKLAPDHKIRNISGWLIGSFRFRTHDLFQGFYYDYNFLIMTSGGKLMRVYKKRNIKATSSSRYKELAPLQLEEFSPRTIEHYIADIIVETGVPWD